MAIDRSRNGRGKWIVGGVGLAALLYLLTRGGNGFGLGAAGTANGASSGTSGSPCRVRIDAAGIEVDGRAANLDVTVERCRVAGAADVTATGAAIVGTIAAVVDALRAAGVTVRASPSIWDVVAVGVP